MDKRYQVFVSSTFADLKDERQRIMQTLMEMDCIPAGMELFPAMDEEQMNFIERVIDDCDYYLLLVGGRYGSVSSEGVSFTEKEYDYAVARGVKVIALLHESPEEIPLAKSETDPALRERLLAFRAKAATGRLVKFWNRAEELPGLVSLSLTKTIKAYPAVGWVRGNSLASEDVLRQLNALQRENERLEALVAAQAPKLRPPPNLAGLTEKIDLHGTVRQQAQTRNWRHSFTWRELFSLISPYLEKRPTDDVVKDRLARSIMFARDMQGSMPTIADQLFQTIGIQLRMLGLVDHRLLEGTSAIQWSLTPQGEQTMIELRAVPAKTDGR